MTDSRSPFEKSLTSRLEAFQNTVFTEDLLHSERVRILMVETNLYCRNKLGMRDRKLDSPPTLGEYLAYVKQDIFDNRDSPLVSFSNNAPGDVRAISANTSLGALSKPVAQLDEESRTKLETKLKRNTGINFEPIKGAFSAALCLQEDLLSQANTSLNKTAVVITPGNYEKIQKLDSAARRNKVAELKARGLSLDEIDFVLNGRRAKSMVEDADCPGYHPYSAPLPSDKIDLHMSEIEERYRNLFPPTQERGSRSL
jgi:hypothetical protein